MTRISNSPDHALIVTEYEELDQLIQAFANGHHELMVIIGDGGTGKSERARRTMEAKLGSRKWTLIKGKHSPLDLYRKLYESRLLGVVFDDLDGLLTSRDNLAILKCICETDPVKRVEWGSTHAAFEKWEKPLPTAFESISQICIVANDWKTLSKNVTALQDRGVLIFFRPSALEVHREIARGGWFDDAEVFDFIGRNLFLVTRPSFRLYITAKNHKKSGLDWKSLILRTMDSEADPKLILIARLLADTHYDDLKAPETARERAFKRLGGGSRATYHRHKKDLLDRRGEFDLAHVTVITLQPPRVDPYLRAMTDRRKYLETMRDEPEQRTAQGEAGPEETDNSDEEGSHNNTGLAISKRAAKLRREMGKAAPRRTTSQLRNCVTRSSVSKANKPRR